MSTTNRQTDQTDESPVPQNRLNGDVIAATDRPADQPESSLNGNASADTSRQTGQPESSLIGDASAVTSRQTDQPESSLNCDASAGAARVPIEETGDCEDYTSLSQFRSQSFIRIV